MIVYHMKQSFSMNYKVNVSFFFQVGFHASKESSRKGIRWFENVLRFKIDRMIKDWLSLCYFQYILYSNLNCTQILSVGAFSRQLWDQ